MTKIDLLKQEAEMAYSAFQEALEGVTERQSWAVLPNNGPDYLHSDGSIHGITLHVATCKFMYGSVAFRDSEKRWRDCEREVAGFEPNWKAGVEYLNESQAYWMASWADLLDDQLEDEFKHFRGITWPAWKIIRMVTFHDGYHAGQIAILRYAVGESDIKPPSAAEDIRTSCAELPDW